MTLAGAVRLVDELRAARKTIVFTNGVFDLLHPGHVRYLRHARSLGAQPPVLASPKRALRRKNARA